MMKENWTYKKLGEVCDILDSKRKPITKSDRQAGDIPYYGATGVQDYVKDYIFDGRFLLVGEDGAKWGKDDETAYIIEGKSWVNNHAHILKLHDEVFDLFLKYYLNGKDLNSYITGAVVPKLTQAALVSIPIPVPPIETQRNIVSELDLLQSIIDKQQAQLKELDKLAQAVFYDMFGDPVENEKGWEVKKLEEIGKVITGNTPSTKDEENYSSNDYSFVKPSDIAKEGVSIIETTEFHISTKAFNRSRQLPEGSVLTTCIGIIGKVGILKQSATCNQQINAIIPSAIVEPIYLAYSMIGIRSLLEAMANAPVVPIINKGDFSRVEIPVPPLSLQQSFAAKIESIEKQKAAISQSIAETQKLFDYTMDKYFG